MARFRLITALSVAGFCAFALGGCGGDDDDDGAPGGAGAYPTGGYTATGGTTLPTGGAAPTGGTTAAGGSATGGSATGGSATGGSETGGSAGSAPTGGTAGAAPTGGTAGAAPGGEGGIGPEGGAAGEMPEGGAAGELPVGGAAGELPEGGAAGETMGGAGGEGGAPAGCPGCAVISWNEPATGGAGGAGGAPPAPENGAVLIDFDTGIDVTSAAVRLRLHAPGATGGYMQVFLQYDAGDGTYPSCYRGWTALTSLDTPDPEYRWVGLTDCDPISGYTWIGIQIEAESDTSIAEPTVVKIDEIAIVDSDPAVGPWTFDDASSISDTQWSDTDVMWVNSAEGTATLTWEGP